MSDTVAVALITLGGTLSGALLTYFASLRSARTQLETAKRNTEAQLKVSRESTAAALKTAEESNKTQVDKLLADVKQVEDTQAEGLRGARQALYRDYLVSIYVVLDFLRGNDSIEDDMVGFKAALTTFSQRQTEIDLLASEPVRRKSKEIRTIYVKVVNDNINTPTDRDYEGSYGAVRGELAPLTEGLITTMSEEVRLRGGARDEA